MKTEERATIEGEGSKGDNVWALGTLPKPFDPGDTPPMRTDDGGRTLMRWLIDREPVWMGTKCDIAAFAWMKVQIEEHRPFIGMRGPRVTGTKVPDIGNLSTVGIMNLPQRKPTVDGERDEVIHRIIVARRNDDGGGETRDDRDQPPVDGKTGALAKTAQHLMQELPEFSRIIRMVMIETAVKGTG